jgi:hypothetical protein
VLVRSGSDGARRTASAVAAPTPTSRGTVTPRPTPTAAGTAVTVEGVGLVLPAGWSVGESSPGDTCVTAHAGRCDLRLVRPEVVRASGAEMEAPQPDSPDGWYLGTDVPGCGSGRASGRLTASRLAPVGDRTAQFREWDVTGCSPPSPYPAHPRLWWLPQTRLGLLDQSDDVAADAVVETIVRTAHLPPLPAR